MKLFRRKKERTVIAFQGDTATAARAIYQGRREFPKILLTFKVKHEGFDPKSGEAFDEIEIEMELTDAIEFGNQFMSAISVSIPRMPGAAGRYQFGEAYVG